MKTRDRLDRPKEFYRAFLLLFLVATPLLVLFLYHKGRDTRLDVGTLGDTPFLSGFHADEADLDYRYRWSAAHSEVTFIGVGSARPVSFALEVHGVRPSEVTQPVTMSVSLNGIPLRASEFDPHRPTVITVEQKLGLYEFDVEPIGDIPPAPYTVAIETSTFQPPGDARDLGVKVNKVWLSQTEDGLNLPPIGMILWPLVFVASLYYLLSLLPGALGRVSSFMGASIFFMSLIFYKEYYAVYLPPAAGALGALGVMVWQRDRVRRWPEVVDMSAKGRIAPLLMAIALLVYAAIALGVVFQVDWIGHADYAENAVIARNLASGKGFTVDYLAQFYRDPGPAISHPADTWPLLQPLLTAPFFALFGPTVWAAKLPNLLLVLGLAWSVFALASRLWDRRVGLFAGLLALAHPYFFNAVLYPINDLSFTLIFLLLAWLVWRVASCELRVASCENQNSKLKTQNSVLLGVLAGLLVWSKPTGLVLLLGLALWALRAWWRSGASRRSVPWRGLALAGGAAAVVLLPLVVRNMLAFGVPFYSTEGYDAWILRYYPFHDWEDIYKMYIGGELPHPRWVVGGKFGYQNLVDAIVTNFRWVWQRGILSSPGQGDYVMGLLPLSVVFVGLAALSRPVRSLFGMVGFSIGLYALFVLLYWHFEGRYFQVAVPWLYMLLAWGVFWVWDRVRANIREGLAGNLGLLLLPIAALGFLWPSIPVIADQIRSDTAPTSFVTAMRWLKDNSTPQDVVMTRDPWELNWYAERKAVAIPNDDLETIERTADKYGVTMLQLGGPIDGIDVRRCPNVVGSRPALGKLYCGEERRGYTLVYRDRGLTIYRRR